MRPTERIILMLSVVLNTLLLFWCLTLQNRISDTRESVIKLQDHVLNYMTNENKFMDSTNASMEHISKALDNHSNSIRILAGLPKVTTR